MADESNGIIGKQELVGREAVLDQCDKACEIPETVSATLQS